jgi:hypothetical protein
MRQDLRTGPRYFLNPPLSGSVNDVPARIVDIGAKGCRLELRQSLQPSTRIEVTIDALRLKATVLWCQVDTLNFASDYDGYLAGMAFETPNLELEQFAMELTRHGKAVQIEEMRIFDRFRITAPLTGSFGDVAPVSIVDLSVGGARIAMLQRLTADMTGTLRFQVDGESGPVDVQAIVKWCRPSPIMREHYAGLEIARSEDRLRAAIARLCLRNEARIDIDSLKRKFDVLRLASRAEESNRQMVV